MAISRLRILQNNHTAQAKTECRGVANMIEVSPSIPLFLLLLFFLF